MEERLSHVPETAGHGISLTRFDRRLFHPLLVRIPGRLPFLALTSGPRPRNAARR
jgi:hypothetical protein